MKPNCRRHPDKTAALDCETCGGSYCAFCTTRRTRQEERYDECPVCRGKGKLHPTRARASAKGLAGVLTGIFDYPVRNSGWIMLVSGIVTFSFINAILSFGGGLMFYLSIPIALAVAGFAWSFLLRVVSESADGRDEMPDWPTFTGLWDFAVPALVMILLLAICALPAIGIWYAGARSMTALIAAEAVGLCYFPMGMLALAMGGGVRMLNPIIILPSIFKVGRGYLVAVAALLGIMALRLVTQRIFGESFVSTFVSTTLGFYFFVLQARVIGLLYRVYERELGWFA